MERHLAAAGTPLVIRAFPAKVVHMEAFWDYFWFRMQQLLQMGVAWSRRYGWSRDFGYKLLIFLAIMVLLPGVDVNAASQDVMPML